MKEPDGLKFMNDSMKTYKFRYVLQTRTAFKFFSPNIIIMRMLQNKKSLASDSTDILQYFAKLVSTNLETFSLMLRESKQMISRIQLCSLMHSFMQLLPQFWFGTDYFWLLGGVLIYHSSKCSILMVLFINSHSVSFWNVSKTHDCKPFLAWNA